MLDFFAGDDFVCCFPGVLALINFFLPEFSVFSMVSGGFVDSNSRRSAEAPAVRFSFGSQVFSSVGYPSHLIK